MGVLMDATLERIHIRLLDMMMVFDDLCKKHHLTYYLIGGSALGALRHNGFIPWDDDVDIALPRSDFEKLEKILRSVYQNRPVNNVIYQSTFHTAPTGHFYLYDCKHQTAEHAVAIDIFPLDAVPRSRMQQKIQQIWCQLYHVSAYRKPPQNRGKAWYVATKLFLIFTNKACLNLLEKISKKVITHWNGKETGIVSNLYGLAGYKKEMVPQSFFGNPVYHQFETGMFPIPEKCHEYMTHIYGDYMILPPLEKRIPKHIKEMEGNT